MKKTYLILTSATSLFIFLCLCVSFLSWQVNTAHASETGHYLPSLLNIRDLIMPELGFYFNQYFGYYYADVYKDKSGKEVNTIIVQGQTLNVKTDLHIFTIVPNFLWVTEKKIFGADYALAIAPVFGNTSYQASLATETGYQLDINGSQFAIGDLLLQPLWLGWQWEHFDLSAIYSLYAPVGKYNEDAVDNVGLGFWTNQFQVAGAYYPFKNKATAIVLACTYEINGKKGDVDITPGSHLTLN